MIYVYALMEPPSQLPELTGLGEAPVERLDVAGLAVAASRHAGEPPKLSDEGVLRHAHVVEELTGSGAVVLPARFGLVFGDGEALERAVQANAEQLRTAIARVRGCVELGLRVLLPEQAGGRAAVAQGGGEYLRARLRETTERDRLARELHDALAGLARDSTHSAPVSGQLLLSAAYLVADDDVETFRRAVRTLEDSHPELAIVCTGPWPAYSFAASTVGAAP